VDARARRGRAGRAGLGLAVLVALVVNAGSTSLKLHRVEGGDSQPVDSLDVACDLVAHRIVHGGERFREPVVVDDAVEQELRALSELAPLHNGPALDALDRARQALPDVPHVAVFDTAFHATLPDEAAVYAVPLQWRERWGIRRYGFHGLSVEWAAERVPAPRLVVCHLGGGCSVTAVLEGRSVETSMGFSPLEGVPMATRSGTLDVEIALHLVRSGRLTVDEVEHALERESGLLALGGSGDVRRLEPDGLALRVFCRRVAGAVAASAAALGGLDAIVFTGGIGENAAAVRSRICERLAFLGVRLDAARNEAASPDCYVHAGAVRVAVVRAREELVAARAASAAVAG
jgi:acetate kinase